MLITTYPYFKVREWSIPRDKTKCFAPLEFVNRLSRYLPHYIKEWIRLFQKILFDRCGAWAIPADSDIVVGWSGSALRCLKTAKELGAVTVVERGSAHILTQLEILEEEYRRAGLRLRSHHERVTDRGLHEYTEADFIAVPSAFAEQSFVDHGIWRTRLQRNVYGVDLGGFHPAPAPRGTSDLRVIYVGALSLQKGARYLLEVVDSLRGDRVEFVHVGRVDDEVRKHLLLPARENLELRGSVTQKELAHHYADCDVFLFPSLHDGFGMVILQAMSCGLPIIGTTTSGCPDVVRNGVEGFVVPSRDPDAIVERLRYLRRNPEAREDMGRAAARRVRQGFGWSDYGDRAVDEYRRILSVDASSGPFVHGAINKDSSAGNGGL
jgi:glycosyltransferase involved in cell wall biosynthesis